MNIFALDKNPSMAAQYHCDKHVVKMILETAQLCSTVHWITGNEAPYKPGWKNHPCTLWLLESAQNYDWAIALGLELVKEYRHRYNGKEHKTESVLKWLNSNRPQLPDFPLTNFALAMPDDCIVDCPIDSYRLYYATNKYKIASWTNREVPDWFVTTFENLDMISYQTRIFENQFGDRLTRIYQMNKGYSHLVRIKLEDGKMSQFIDLKTENLREAISKVSQNRNGKCRFKKV